MEMLNRCLHAHTHTHSPNFKANWPQVGHRCFQTVRAIICREHSLWSIESDVFIGTNLCPNSGDLTLNVHLLKLPLPSLHPSIHRSIPTSSFMPVSSSIMTQASIGRAISRLLLFRCSSRDVPNAGFSIQESSGNSHKCSSVKALFIVQLFYRQWWLCYNADTFSVPMDTFREEKFSLITQQYLQNFSSSNCKKLVI